MSTSAVRLSDLVKRYSSIITEELGIDYLASKILFYLFEQRVHQNNPEHSAYDIYKGMRSQGKSLLALFGKAENITEKSVEKAIRDLLAMDFLRARPGTKKRKVSGRPAKYLYTLRNSREIMRLIEKRMRQKKQLVFEVFANLSEIEEAAGLTTQGGVVNGRNT